jgi:glycosyltransferase involved in cell wall biosynthesis
MVLFLHSRYRSTGGEERVVEQLMRLVREHMGEPVGLLERDSARLSSSRAASGLLRGGLDPEEVRATVERTGARVVHAHNLHPTFGWRALAAARAGGARVVLHLHQYRLVCAIGVCYTRGAPCTRCHGHNTLPGVLWRCRGDTTEALVYGLGLTLWQRRIVEEADAVLVPSAFALGRLRELGAPLPWERVQVLAPPLGDFAASSRAASGSYALVTSRLAPEKGVDVAIDACRIARLPLVIAGEGPERATLEARAAQTYAAVGDWSSYHSAPGHDRGGSADDKGVRFLGQVGAEQLGRLREGAAIVLIPSRSENFSTAAAEAMAAGVPVVASRVGGLPELIGEDGLVNPDDPVALATAIERRWGDEDAARDGLERVRALCDPAAVAAKLQQVYGGASGI